jgi:hypothetical protein
MTAPTTDATAHPFALSRQQVTFFRTFGFLQLPRLFADYRDELDAGFEEAFATDATPFVLDPSNPYHQPRDPAYADVPRQIVPGFIERSPRLARLRTHPRLVGLVSSLLGDDYVYAESDGNRFNCDVYWHVDAYHSPLQRNNLKVYFYLDEVSRDSGALRVIPGTHLVDSAYTDLLRHDLFEPGKVAEIFGVELDQIPSWTLEARPGDVIVGDFRTLHGSFRGAPGRRLFTINFHENL